MKRIEKLTHPEPVSESLQKQGFIQVSFSTEDVIEKLNEVVTALNELAEQHERRIAALEARERTTDED